MPSVLTIAGSLRTDAHTTKLLVAAEAELARLGCTVTRFDVATMPRYNQDLDTENPPALVGELRSLIASHDALAISTPSYNHSITGALKDTIDWASRPYGHSCFAGRQVMILTTSLGPGAGREAGDYLADLLPLFRASIASRASVGKITHHLNDANLLTGSGVEQVNEASQALALFASGATVVDNADAGRWELLLDGDVVGFAEYSRFGDAVEFPHTVSEPSHRGRGVAATLVRAALTSHLAAGTRVIPSCSFVASFIASNPEFAPLVS